MTKIYYFSGRGSSLYTVRELAQLLRADKPLPMTGRYHPDRIVPGRADRVGFVFPVIDFGVPVSVRQYISTYPPQTARYCHLHTNQQVLRTNK